MTVHENARRVSVRYGKEELILETGRMAKQADGACLVQYGGTMVLVSVVIAKEPKPSVNFLPLTVEYQEKTYAAGKIPGGFFKREGRPSEKEILTARLIDRPIRSLFPKGFRNEVQVIALVLSHDGANDPDVLAILGASAALGLAGAPVDQRLGVARVGRVNGQFVLNPTYAEEEQGDLDLVVVSHRDGIVMLEAGAKEVPEGVMVEAMRFGQTEGQAAIRLQEELLAQVSTPKREFPLGQLDPQLLAKARSLAEEKIKELMRAQVEKEQAGEGMKALSREVFEKLSPPAQDPAKAEEILTQARVEEALEEIEKGLMRKMVLEEKRRLDGRDFTTVRPITCEVGVLPRAHGSGLFTRGQTQSLAAATLGTSRDEQMIDALEGKTYKSFMLHYSFPPFSVGEIRPMRGPGRREIGHGALAERALKAVMPAKEAFPYTVRVVSEILESNGSSSMATVCGSTLALMDAGVPIKAPVTGMAMGLVKEGSRYAILTDIIGMEDHFGDMDFKITGTSQGVTALQLDLKLAGVDLAILTEAIEQSRPARMLVLEKIQATLTAPRSDLSPYAPRITVLKIDPEKIGEVIGPGGKMIRKITKESGATVEIEDDGTVLVASADLKATEMALAMIKGITQEAEVGKVYQGVVKRIMNFGAFLEIAPGKEGLCHVSELSEQFVPKVEEVVKLGDTLAVKVVEVDSQGRINLSHKQALLPPGTPPVPPRRGPERPRGGDDYPRRHSGEGDHGRRPREREHSGGRGGPPRRAPAPGAPSGFRERPWERPA